MKVLIPAACSCHLAQFNVGWTMICGLLGIDQPNRCTIATDAISGKRQSALIK
jgi:hypothetical protein